MKKALAALLIAALTLMGCALAEEAAVPEPDAVQLRMFPEHGAEDAPEVEDTASRERERRLQLATLAIRKKYGGNAVFRGMDLQEDATARIRSGQIGGHRA